MSPVVLLHVGAPKTGTTYLQDRLTVNARSLASHGVHFPSRSPLISPGLFQFRAALDLLGQDWGGRYGSTEGNWDALARRARRRSGRVVISHEILAPATPDQVARVRRDLAGCELHVVYSARDLARQLPAAWQESIKQGRRWSFRRFLRDVTEGTNWFSGALDLPRVLSTWGEGLPPERIHLVTVPQRGAPRDLLWRRFCEAFGIDPAWAPRESERSNRSLGAAEAQVIRRLNRRFERSTRHSPEYDELIREVLAQQRLAARDSAPITLPPRLQPWVDARTDEWLAWVAGSGIDVIGDVEDLRSPPHDPATRWRNPDKVSAKRQLAVAVEAVAAMTHEAASRKDPRHRLLARARKARPGGTPH